ncbi:hypothetical protein IP92_04128 [Pseudoduganella flava]|uniref:Uncharacterized protein n=1 Tax=Pseudoduganella flava TaxID=871742 RepID=A0A562PKV9_9BURK|nr:hypothetical protein [Pseudoduganella flava]QGZ42393.1 hypothetical protein GO485_27410 [Pseudoduganella flava]TWI44953.1 hypothetical protein IP92_04128 [Pseudoduganella flava]
MTTIVGKTLGAPSGPYWYWITLGPRNIDLTDTHADIPPGRYELNWDFRGISGETLKFEISTKGGAILMTESSTIQKGEVDDWGSKYFTVADEQ